MDIDVLWGAYYSYQVESGEYSIFRLLDFNKDAFHYSVYQETFSQEPSLKQVKSLRPFIGHVPQALGALLNKKHLHILGKHKLSRDDLYGYLIYLSEMGMTSEQQDELANRLIGYSLEIPLKLRLQGDCDNVKVLMLDKNED